MPHPLFKNDEERRMALIAAAGVALHGLLAGGAEHGPGSGPLSTPGLVQRAFEIGEAFVADAARRLSLP
jgi:hypothetical protein